MKWKQLFSAKSGSYYDLFDRVAGNLVTMARLLQQVAYNNESSINKDLLQKMEHLEHENDHATHDIYIQLSRNFITPFDREDIHTLASNMDDIADFTWGAVKQMENYQFFYPGETTVVFANRHHQTVKQLATAVRELRHLKAFPALGALCREINREIQQTSTYVDEALMRVYADRLDFKETVQLIDHYEMLHSILEKCSTVVRTIEIVVVKYG